MANLCGRKISDIFVRFETNLEFLDRRFIKTLNAKILTEILAVVAALIHWRQEDGRADGRDDAKRRFSRQGEKRLKGK